MAEWHSFYHEAWLIGTHGLSMSETGLYINLVATMYDHGGPISREVALRLFPTCGRRVAGTLERLITLGKITVLDDGRLWNRRCEIEIEKTLNRRSAGKVGADARWGTQTRIDKNAQRKSYKREGFSEQNQRPVDAVAMPIQDNTEEDTVLESRDNLDTLGVRSQNDSDADASPTARKKLNGKAVKATRLEPDWMPTEDDCEVGIQRGLNATQIEDQHSRFMDYWLARPGTGGTKLNWNSTFRNWLRRAADEKSIRR